MLLRDYGDVGQQTFAQFKNSTRIKAATADREQLLDRQTEGKDDQKGSVTSIDDLSTRRIGGNLANASLANRKSLRDVNREDAATIEHSDMRNTELTDHSQRGQLSEHRSLVRSVDRDVSQDTTNR